MKIRPYHPSDCPVLAALFYDTVHTVNAKDYSQEQLAAWADGHNDLSAWNRSFLAHITYVADCGGTIVGFGDIDKSGYLDRLYVHKDYQRRKIATALCDMLEGACKAAEITTQASITAKPFFEQRGYSVVQEQQVVRKQVMLTNFIMKKYMIL